jgi:hypothetical protein
MTVSKLPEGMTHRELFATTLKFASGSLYNDEKKRLLESIPKNLVTDKVTGKQEPLRELLMSTTIEGSNLIQTEMNATVQEGAELEKVYRDILPVFQTRAGVLRVPIGATGTSAGRVAEGAEIPVDFQDWGYRDFTVYKYGSTPMISQELIDRSLYDVIALEVAKAGARCENALNKYCHGTLLDNAGNEDDANVSGSGTDTYLKSAAKAMGLNMADHYTSDVMVMSPLFATGILAAMVPASTIGDSGQIGYDMAKSGKVGSILGMRTYVYAGDNSSSTYTWSYGTDGYIGAMVLNAKNAGAIAMEKDISVDQEVSKVKQVVNCPVSIRFGVNYLMANAIARCEY